MSNKNIPLDINIDMDDLNDIEANSLRERIIFSLFRPVVGIAAESDIPLKRLARILKMAYFNEYRRQGNTWAEISDSLDISMATAARLARSLKQNFLDAEKEYELGHRIQVLIIMNPASIDMMKLAFPDAEEDEIRAEVDTLLASNVICECNDKPGYFDLVDHKKWYYWGHNYWFQKITSLNQMMDSLGDTVSSRFFKPEKPAYARTARVRIAPEYADELTTLYDEVIKPKMFELEARTVDNNKKSNPISVTYYWVSSDD